MKITREHLADAASAGVIDTEQAHALWRFLAKEHADTPSFRAAFSLAPM